VHPETARLFDGLADTLGPGAPAPTTSFELTTLETRGRWMRVRLRAPFDVCEGQDTAGVPVREAWIAYLDPRGRPLMFYPPRGC
jgi:hypothetical protein